MGVINLAEIQQQFPNIQNLTPLAVASGQKVVSASPTSLIPREHARPPRLWALGLEVLLDQPVEQRRAKAARSARPTPNGRGYDLLEDPASRSQAGSALFWEGEGLDLGEAHGASDSS